MKKKKLIVFILIILVLISLAIICSIYFINKNGKDNDNKDNYKEISEDARKFKEEYESLNNTIKESDGVEYNSITIPEDNPIVYVNIEEALDIIKNGSGIMYIGANNCPWCRTMIPVMFEVAKDLNIDKIYYLTLKDQKSRKEDLDELKSLVWEDYASRDENGEIRIFIPFVIPFKDGKISLKKRLSYDINEDQTKYDPLTESQHQELYNILHEIMSQ